MTTISSRIPTEDPIVTRRGLFAIFALLLFALTATTAARLTGLGTSRVATPAAIETRDLQFTDGDRGAVLVYDAAEHRLVDTIAPGAGGFVRVVLRGLARERKLSDIGPVPPFRLTRFADGRLMLTDPSTQKQVDLGAFGDANARSFARLMTVGRT